MNARELALKMLMQITEEQKLSHTVMARELAAVPEMDKKERSFASMLCQGVVERKETLDFLIAQYSSVKPQKMKPLVRNIIRMGFYQLAYTSVPPSAVCNEAVKLVKKKGLGGLSGFVNGVLRSYAREPKKPEAFLGQASEMRKLALCYSVPEWLAEKFVAWYGIDLTREMFEVFLQRSDLTVRVNRSRVSREACIKSLVSDGVCVSDGRWLAQALRLSGVDTLEKLSAFREGYIQVQDESSMLPVLCAGLKDGDYVIDCCAAPGGKALQAADILQQGRVSARDVSEYKLNKLRENVERLGFQNVELLLQDATQVRAEDIGKADVVLADLPCSGLGIIARKPDIKYHATEEGMRSLQELQRKILATVVKYLKPGGVLIFSTCTINPGENIENVRWIREELGLCESSLDPYLPDGLKNADTKKGYLQLLPLANTSDGFFVSRFQKQ